VLKANSIFFLQKFLLQANNFLWETLLFKDGWGWWWWRFVSRVKDRKIKGELLIQRFLIWVASLAGVKSTVTPAENDVVKAIRGRLTRVKDVLQEAPTQVRKVEVIIILKGTALNRGTAIGLVNTSALFFLWFGSAFLNFFALPDSVS